MSASCLVSPGYAVKAVGVLALLLAIWLGTWYLESDGIETVWTSSSTQSNTGYAPNSGGRLETRTRYKIRDWVLQMRARWSEALLELVAGWAETKQDDLIARLDARAPRNVPLLCQTAINADEALAALGKWLPFFEAGNSFLSSDLTSRVFIAIVLIVCWGGGIAAALSIPIEFIRENGFSFLAPFSGSLVGLSLGSLVFFILTAGSLVIGSLLIPFWMFIRAPTAWPDLFAYGSADLWAVYFTRTYVAAKPRSDEDSKVVISAYDFSGVAGLKHSAYYADDRVINDIVNWIRPLLKPR